MNSLLCCPVCGNPLTFAERSAYCKNGHTYDRAARGGYIHLLRQQRRGSSDPGDSAEMCQARTRFLEGGWYAPLRNQLAAQVKQLAPNDIFRCRLRRRLVHPCHFRSAPPRPHCRH